MGRVTSRQLSEFVAACSAKQRRAKIEPGTAVGALAAQSIGEPATQVTRWIVDDDDDDD